MTIFCDTCGGEMTNYGAISMGDGDLSDEYGCAICGETKLIGTRWSYDGVNWYSSQEEANFMTGNWPPDFCPKCGSKNWRCKVENQDEVIFKCDDCEHAQAYDNDNQSPDPPEYDDADADYFAAVWNSKY